MIVIFSDWFKYEQYPHLNIGFKLKLNEFREAVLNDDMSVLKGRNKSSDDVDFDNNNFINDIKFAQQYNLWHYHLGIPKYEQSKKRRFNI